MIQEYELNRVQGFNPLAHCILIDQRNGNGKAQYLEVKYRKYWFRLAFPEGKIDIDMQLNTQNGIFVACARVYTDKNDPVDSYLAKDYAARALRDASGNLNQNAATDAATAAIGRALSSAGFGTGIGGNEEAEAQPCESGIAVADDWLIFPTDDYAESVVLPEMQEQEQVQVQVQEQSKQKVQTNTTSNQKAQTAQQNTDEKAQKQIEQKQVEQKQVEQKQVEQKQVEQKQVEQKQVESATPAKPRERAKPTSAGTMSLADAKAMKIPMGPKAGTTLGEIWATDPNTVRFYTKDTFDTIGRHPELKAAARIIVNSEQ